MRISSKNKLKANHNASPLTLSAHALMRISSKNKLKANHNQLSIMEKKNSTDANIIKEQIESKSQLRYLSTGEVW